MEQTKQQIPAEAVEAYTQYIHGEIDRRAFMSRVNKVAVSTVAAAAIVDQLMPNWRLCRAELNRLPVRHEDWAY